MSSVRSIAQALVELSEGRSGPELSSLADAATQLVRKKSPSALAKFPRLVARELKSRRTMKDAQLTTPSGSLGEDHKRFLDTLGKALKTPVSLTEHSDPSLLGGAVLRIGDERFDASLQSALIRLQENLRAPVSIR